MSEEQKRKRKLVDALSQPRYGPMTLRALAAIALDVHKIDQMSDAELLRVPGIGVKSLQGIRRHLADYFNEE